jgi:glycosyltransferase involved in cell wall biosynthesis
LPHRRENQLLMRVLLAASKYLPEYSGAAYRLNRLYGSLLHETPDWSVQVVCGGVEKSRRADYEFDNIPVHRIGSRAPSATGRISHAIYEWCDAFETWQSMSGRTCDVVHTVGTSAVVATAIAWARSHRAPLLIELVTSGAVPDQGLPLINRLHRPDLHKGAAIVTISRPLAERCRRRGYNTNVWLRPNPVDTDRFVLDRTKRLAARREVSPFGESDVVIVTVAKLMPQKNQIFLLDVLARLQPRFKLLIAGPLVSSGPLAKRDQDYYRALRSRISELDLGERVHVVPEFVRADDFIKAGDIFAAPSVEEGLGTPLLEAQACGLPVIANRDVPAFHDSIEDGDIGLLRPLDADEWAEAAMAAEKVDRARLDGRAEEIAERHSFTATRDNYRRLLEHLAKAGPNTAIDVNSVLNPSEPGASLRSV